MKQKSNKKIIIIVMGIIIICLFVGICFLYFRNAPEYESTYNTSSGMEDTIQVNATIKYNKNAYVGSKKPERYDIILFKCPDDESQSYVKRIIGLPGENVVIKDAKIYIDGSEKPLEEDYLNDEWVDAIGPFEFNVPEGCYLVLGDNRNDSYDSRYWNDSYVKFYDILGKVVKINNP